MAAFTGSPTDSTQRANEKDSAVKADLRDASALKVKVAKYTHAAGAGTGEVNLFTLPPGRIRIYPDLCRVISTAMATNADLHIGHRAYNQEDGTLIAEDDNEWLNNADAGSAIDSVLTDGGTTDNQYESRAGIVVFAMIDTGNIEDTDTIYVHMVYSGGDGN